MRLTCRYIFLILGAISITAFPGEVKAQSSVTLPTSAAEVGRQFLFAFAQNDRDTVSKLLPSRLENLYGPSPFAAMPTLSNPRVDSRVGAIDFEGRMVDSYLPRKGTIILRLIEERGERNWTVRQIYWYEQLPRGVDIPDSSPTADDRRQEPRVQQAARDFISAWMKRDFRKMETLTFRWWEVDRRPPRWVTMMGADLTARPTMLDGLRVDFVAQLRLGRLIPKSVEGNFWLVQEEGIWRVRPLTFMFAF